MGYELAEQLTWSLPDWIIYPTGGGTGLVGMWKAFAEMEAIGWLAAGQRPKMVSVQTEGCAPIIRAFASGAETAGTWEHAHTVADGLRVPRAIADFLILRAIRESGGTAVAVSDKQMVEDMMVMGRDEGVSAAPEGAASLSAVRQLVADGKIKKHDTVVLFTPAAPGTSTFSIGLHVWPGQHPLRPARFTAFRARHVAEALLPIREGGDGCARSCRSDRALRKSDSK
jgi:threonine synthase